MRQTHHSVQFHFILVQPAVPENVGSAARALKTMGFRQMRLVNPCDYLSDKGRLLAFKSEEILERAKVYPTLNKATSDLDFIIATTARRRSLDHDYHSPEDLIPFLVKKKSLIRKVGIVFGPEERGLSNEELNLCDLVSSVPMRRPYPSLNLAQAVMVFAYTLSPLSLKPKRIARVPRPDLPTYRVFREKLEELFDTVGLKKDSFVARRLLEKIGILDADEVKLIHTVRRTVMRKLENP